MPSTEKSAAPFDGAPIRCAECCHDAVAERTFNDVDATYKADLKGTNELNLQRFKATLHEEISSLRGELRQEISSLRRELEMASLRAEISSLRDDLLSELKAFQANMMKWMFIYWSGTVAAIIGMGYFGPK